LEFCSAPPKAGKETTENFAFETIAAKTQYQFSVFSALKSGAEDPASDTI
jgi:hypothetical protein